MSAEEMNLDSAKNFLRPRERLDDLQCKGLYIIQDPARFCFGSDAVCLANFAVVRKKENAIDLCAGSGVVSLLLSAKTRGRHFTGLELQPEVACMARRSVRMNGLEERITIDCGDIKQAPSRYGLGAFDVLTVNPPYLQTGKLSGNPSVALARHELACTLGDVLSVSARLLRYGGRLYLVHRPERLTDLLCGLRERKLEPKKLQCVQAGPHREPVLILVEAVLGGGPGLKIPPALILGEEASVGRGPHDVHQTQGHA